MKGERGLLHIGEYLVARASRLLPGEVREERRREWAAELPAILRDPDTRLAARRAARMLRYAAGTAWATASAPGNARGRLTTVMAPLVALFTVSFLTLAVTNTISVVNAPPGDWVSYFWITSGVINLAWLGRILVQQIRRAERPMEAIRDTVLDYGAWLIPDWLLSPLLRAVGADRSDLPAKTDVACSPAPRPAASAGSAEQAIGLARDTVGRFYRVRLRPGYQIADVDEFIAQIEATLTTGGQPGQVVTAAEVEAVKFGITRRRGYDEQVVDEALDYYADGLARLALFPRPQ